MNYTSQAELMRMKALSDALRGNNNQQLLPNWASGLAYMLNQGRAGRLDRQATEAETKNADITKNELARVLAESNSNFVGPQSNIGLQSPEAQNLAQSLVLSKQRQYGQTPASMTEWNFFKGLSPEEKQQFLMLQGSGYGVYLPEQRGIARKEDVSDVEALAQPRADAAAMQARQVGDVQTEIELDRQAQMYNQQRGQEVAEQQPVQAAKLSQKTDQFEMLDGLIDDAINAAGTFTTGFIGSSLSKVPGTPAHDLNAQLETIRANIGFDRLQQMRESSPTGGALGSVSERENSLLQAVWGNLQNSQSKEQFIQNLELVREQVKRSWERVAEAYEKDYGVPMQESTPQNTNTADDDLLKKYGF